MSDEPNHVPQAHHWTVTNTFFSPNLIIIIMGTFWNTSNPQKTIWNNIISHRFISLLLFTKATHYHYADDAWTSNACHGHNFHHMDLKFSDSVPNTIMIMNKKFKHICHKLQKLTQFCTHIPWKISIQTWWY